MKLQVSQAKISEKKPRLYFCQGADILFTKQVFSGNNADSVRKLFEKHALSGLQPVDSAYTVFFMPVSKGKGLDSLEHIRIAAAIAADSLRKRGIQQVQISVEQASPESVRAIAMGLLYSNYNFDNFKSKKAELSPFQANFMCERTSLASLKAVVDSCQKIMSGIDLARDLVNNPGGSLVPADFVKTARNCAKEFNLKIKVREEAALRREGFNGLLTVGKGSLNPPALVTLEYNPPKAIKGKKLAMVGKGITFDTGGISLKPPGSMWEMRCDMGGAAAVLGAMCNIASLKIPLQVTAILCLAENRPGMHAVLPGDIFTAKNGKTIMVENTDAEGRLVLSDGLAEAGLKKATHIVDLATLTGAIVRAIGGSMSGLFSNDEELSQQVVRNGLKNGEKFWPMPLEMEYRASLDDKVADLRNIGEEAGAITAALFLQEFVPEGARWAHWDIAGTAFKTKPWKYFQHGATGWGVQSLTSLADDLSRNS